MKYKKSFVEYTDSTPWLHVLCVCLLAFSPAFAVTILIELLPLRPPSDGWKANWVFWLRIYLSCGLVSFGSAVQFILLIPACGLSLKHAFYICLGASLGYLIPNLVLAQIWRFPIPFALAIVAPSWYASLYICTFLAIGIKRLRQNPEVIKQAKAAIPILLAQSLLVLVYPVYNAIFLRLRGTDQILFILLLPVIKYIMNLLIGRLCDEVPAAKAIGMVSVKLFEALYMFKCMGSAGSLVSGIVLITLDLVQNMYHFRKLHNRVWKMRQHLAKRSVDVGYKAVIHNSMSRAASRSYSIVHLRGIDTSVLKKNRITPSPPSGTRALPPSIGLRAPVSAWGEENSLAQLDEEVRELLLESERIILVEYIEAAVPMFYAFYLVILFHLPNAKYYPETEHLDIIKLTRTVCNIAAYAALEFASLLYVHLFLRWKLNISALHMLAHVLERDNAILQSVFMSWVIVVLQWTVKHGGTQHFWYHIKMHLPRILTICVHLGVDYSLKISF